MDQEGTPLFDPLVEGYVLGRLEERKLWLADFGGRCRVAIGRKREKREPVRRGGTVHVSKALIYVCTR